MEIFKTLLTNGQECGIIYTERKRGNHMWKKIKNFIYKWNPFFIWGMWWDEKRGTEYLTRLPKHLWLRGMLTDKEWMEEHFTIVSRTHIIWEGEE
jgi:hypothetical protein